MEPNFLILYVADMPTSRAFYTDLIGISPIEDSEHFVMFKLSSGMLFGLWLKDDVQPLATVPGGVEIALPLGSRVDVDSTLEAWRSRGIRIVQEPTTLDFGYTFVALDPDGHRVRIYAPAERAYASQELLKG